MNLILNVVTKYIIVVLKILTCAKRASIYYIYFYTLGKQNCCRQQRIEQRNYKW